MEIKIKVEKTKMGNAWGSSFQFINLSRDFFEEYLGEPYSLYTIFYFREYQKPYFTKTNIQCPFCEKGVLELVEKKKSICEVHVVHIGDEYLFKCSERCGGIFHYLERWIFC